LLRYRGWDDRAAEQRVAFTGTPAKVGRYLWRLICPDTGQRVQALYLPPDGDRFQSRQESELKYRRAYGKAAQHLRRCYKLMHKLQTDHFGPGIGKPAGMSDRNLTSSNGSSPKSTSAINARCLEQRALHEHRHAAIKAILLRLDGCRNPGC
jgi:hypothetical protein